MFSEFKKQVQNQFLTLSTTGQLYYVSINRDIIFEEYLNGFSLEERQGHNCNCCKSFLRQYGGVVAIIDNKKVTLWDNLSVSAEYEQSVKNLKSYIHSLPITDIFVSETKDAGTDKNVSIKTGDLWEHFFLNIPTRYVHPKLNIPTLLGDKRVNKDVIKRSLEELTIQSTEEVLELMNQGSLYRGKEFENALKEFYTVQKEYKTIPQDLKDNFAWKTSIEKANISRIRNTALGTLLINLSENMDLDTAVSKWESIMAPSNYKRPNSLVTPKMVEEAKKKIQELGIEESLERRFANESDLNTEDIIFTDKTTSVKDVFDEISSEGLVNPKTLSKVEEIDIEDFIEKVVPTSKSIEVLLENNHSNHLVTLLTSKSSGAPHMFKWNNNFSWAYSGGVADSLKERVKQAGGKVDGLLRFSIQWNEDGTSICDLDAHCHYGGNHIYYGFKNNGEGFLDVDMIRPKQVGIENIAFNRIQEKDYHFSIKNYDGGRHSGFKAQIEFNGEIYDFNYPKHFNDTVEIATLKYSKTKGFQLISHLESSSNITSKEVWSLKTNKFHKVKKMMLSPNYWGTNKGNKHYFFMLEGCMTDEKPRPFFNEYLKPELEKERKVFEVLGSKLKIEDTSNQLSGLGFSETLKDSLIVRVEGKTKRNLKIKF